MTPRRTAVKTAKTEAAQFDFDKFLAGFVRPEFTASLIRRADLAPKLAEQEKILDDLDKRIDRLETAEGEDGEERDITAVHALPELIDRRNRLTAKYNDMAQEYNDSAVSFTFRVPDKKGDHVRIQEMMAEIGAEQPEQPAEIVVSENGYTDPDVVAELNERNKKEFEEAFGVWWDTLAIRSMTVTCTEHPGTKLGAPPLTVEQWEALRDTVGPAAFNSLGNAWFEAVQAAVPSAPFSQRPLLTPETEPL